MVARKLWRNPPLVKWTPSSFGNLVQHDDQPDAGLEADQHRFGDEVGDEPSRSTEASNRDGAYQKGQRRRSTEESGGVAVGCDWPSSAPTRIAMVVVVLTLSGREVPSTA